MRLTICLLGWALALAGPARAATDPAEARLAGELAEAAQQWLASLTAAERRAASFSLVDPERTNWHYVPRARRGVALGALTETARARAGALLGAALGGSGLDKAMRIMALEAHAHRDAGAYFISIFGAPSTRATWGLRVEGHHLSLNLTVVDGARVLVAPIFFGAAPALPTLAREEELGVRLLASLGAAEKKIALYPTAAPEDLFCGPDEPLTELPGLAGARMPAAARALVGAIVDESLANLPRAVAERERARLAAAGGVDKIVLTWAGGAATGAPHYFRLSGPTFLYELDNTADNATHLHTVWHARQPGGDFAIDLLRQPYRLQANAELHGDWSAPVEPRRILGNIYYVGGRNIASYLLTTQEGHIVIDSGTREMAPVVAANLRKLGVRLADVKILLANHAHFDHVGGHAALQRASGGAKIMVMRGDVAAMETGVDRSPLADAEVWEPVRVDRVLDDGDVIRLGGTTLRALAAPGHTPGCTVFTTETRDGGRDYSVVFYGCAGPNTGVKLVGNAAFPHLVDETLRSFARLAQLHPDLYLTMHPRFFDAPRVDKAAWPQLIAAQAAAFLRRLRQEEDAAEMVRRGDASFPALIDGAGR